MLNSTQRAQEVKRTLFIVKQTDLTSAHGPFSKVCPSSYVMNITGPQKTSNERGTLAQNPQISFSLVWE
jgi:hypothetical protein